MLRLYRVSNDSVRWAVHPRKRFHQRDLSKGGCLKMMVGGGESYGWEKIWWCNPVCEGYLVLSNRIPSSLRFETIRNVDQSSSADMSFTTSFSESSNISLFSISAMSLLLFCSYWVLLLYFPSFALVLPRILAEIPRYTTVPPAAGIMSICMAYCIER